MGLLEGKEKPGTLRVKCLFKFYSNLTIWISMDDTNGYEQHSNGQ